MAEPKEAHKLYPLKFKPILKKKVWGGGKLHALFHKEEGSNTGESWELSGVTDAVSIVSNGALKGKNLNDLLGSYQSKLVGRRVFKQFGNQFPLLFKFIDAAEDLSVQLHPNDELAKIRHDSFGKTEMWYVLEAEQNARLILGFNKEMDERTYKKHLSENNITAILNSEPVLKGDAFFIAPGTVHAIGAGIVLAEIQQTSDITYRIYDWDRPGLDGVMRELHNDFAIDAINYEALNAKQDYIDVKNETVPICSSPYFETNKLRLSKTIQKDYTKLDSFVVYMCVDGEVVIRDGAYSENLIKGETLLLSATSKIVHIETENATLLEVYIP
jgi:mannose-6-phosphate isomerase